MDERIIFYLLVLVNGNAAIVYFHNLSPIMLKPTSSNPESNFGFSMGFQDTIPAKLIVGAPRADFIGQVYKCTIIDIEDTISCDLLNIDLEKIANYTLAINPNQHFYLGSSIAATSDYFLTCAPLWIPSAKIGRTPIDAYGTCFVYNNDYVPFNGTFERIRRRLVNRRDMLVGGTGWNTLFDKNNKLILVAKPTLQGDIVYVPSESPLNYSKSIIEHLNTDTLDKIRAVSNVGTGLAAGNFFSNSTVYAFSMTAISLTGQIGFLKYNQNEGLLEIMTEKNNKDPFVLINKQIGSMFGAVLHSEDINKDGWSELIVGAPVASYEDLTPEQGAVYIYLGGDTNINDKERMRAIIAVNEGGRFGSAIATNDVDGDGIPELIISSPYEDAGTGAVYILSGYELNTTLLGQHSKQIFFLTELKYTQKLQPIGVRTFGYSLQIVSDLDNNGCNELAVGSPGSDSVLLFRCVPALTVALQAKLLGQKYVKEQAENFVVAVCVDIDFKVIPLAATGTLEVDTSIVGYDAYMPISKYTIDLSKRISVLCENITVKLSEKGEGDYKFSARAQLASKDQNTIMETRVFNTSWVTVRNHSATATTLKIVRRCEAKDCDSNLTALLNWSGGDVYTLGSSINETVMVTVHNSGHQSVGSCAWVKISGAPVRLVECPPDGEGYRCKLVSPLRRDKKESLRFTLNMTTPRSTDERLVVEVRVHENCGQPENKTYELKAKYRLPAEVVYFHGIAKDRNVTEKELLDEKIEIISDSHEYEIVNNASIQWMNVTAVIAIENKPFIRSYTAALILPQSVPCQVKTFNYYPHIQSTAYLFTAPPVSIAETDCIEKSKVDKKIFACNFILMPNSRKIATVTMEIHKDRILRNLINGRLNTTSQLTLYLTPKLPPQSKNVTMHTIYLQERSIVNNKLVIILTAVTLALLLLAGFIYILYKNNFFKRKQKKKLNELRESIRRSVKKPSEQTEQNKNKDEDKEEDMVIEVVEESFEVSQTADDEAILIEEKAQVHC